MNFNRHCCKNSKSQQHKQRYIPTFVHQPIFFYEPSQTVKVRFTPTFYSCALNTEGYNIKTEHAKRQKSQIRPKTAVHKIIHSNYSHEKRIQDLNPKCQVFYSSKDNWYDHTKQNMLKTIRNYTYRDCSKQRKYLNLASDPVFTDFDYAPKNLQVKVYKLQQKNPQSSVAIQQTQSIPVQTRDSTAPDQQKDQNQNTQEQNKIIQKKTQVQHYQKKTHKDFHKNCFGLQDLAVTKKSNSRSKNARSSNKVKIVSSNPTFSVVRGNKIDNRL